MCESVNILNCLNMYESHYVLELFVRIWTLVQADFFALVRVPLLVDVFVCVRSPTLLRYLNWNGDASAI
jgi:hypothetical protein